MNFLKKLKKNEAGATAIEYALIAALIAIGIIAALGTLEDGLTGVFDKAGEKLTAEADKI